jgi:nucleotide-binding universal stress UspA family protein
MSSTDFIMLTILVITNLTESSQHALDYACELLKNRNAPAKIILLRVLPFSAGYAGSGLSLASMQDVLHNEEGVLEAEKIRVQAAYPNLELETRILTGHFTEIVQDEAADASVVIIGAEGDYNQILSWDDHILEVFIDLEVPVLIVPSPVLHHTISNIAFASNYKHEELQKATKLLRKLAESLKATLHFVHVNLNGAVLTGEKLQSKQQWQQELKGLDVEFHELPADNVVKAVEHFCYEYHIDLLAIIPHHAGVWRSIFDKSNTHGFFHINRIPVLALRGDIADPD